MSDNHFVRRGCTTLVIAVVCAFTLLAPAQSVVPSSEEGAAVEPYPNMPSIAPSEGVSSAGSRERSLHDHRQRLSVGVSRL
jgi:hypothetical protein